MIVWILMLIGAYIFYYFTHSLVLVIGLVLVFSLIIIWGSQIKLVSSKQEVDKAIGNIDVAYQKRHDVLIKMIDTIKGAINESDKSKELVSNIIVSVSSQRKPTRSLFEKKNKNARQEYESWIRDSLNTINKLMMDNSTNQHFMMLNRSINDVEENLSAARRFYNYAAKEYNANLHTFPTNIISKMKIYEEVDYFTVENEEIRKDIQINF